MSMHTSKLPVPQACLRLVRVVFHILCGMGIALFFLFRDAEARRRIVKDWSRKLLEVLHIGLQTEGVLRPLNMRGGLLVANHVSWVDIVAMNAIAPACFVAKSEVGSWPLIGWLCRRAGTLFIQRDNRRDAMRVNHEISAMLGQGGNVALFPEGTSSDGVLPGHFHSSLLQGAIDAGASIGPVAIRYHDGMGKACRDAAFVGDMSFAQSLWNILRSPSLCVSLHYLPPLPCAGKARRELAAEAQGAIHMALARFSPNHSVCVTDAPRLCRTAGGPLV